MKKWQSRLCGAGGDLHWATPEELLLAIKIAKHAPEKGMPWPEEYGEEFNRIISRAATKRSFRKKKEYTNEEEREFERVKGLVREKITNKNLDQKTINPRQLGREIFKSESGISEGKLIKASFDVLEEKA